MKLGQANAMACYQLNIPGALKPATVRSNMPWLVERKEMPTQLKVFKI
jgi:hypothetical protein